MIHKSEAALHIKLLNTNTLYTSKREVLFKLMILITTKSFWVEILLTLRSSLYRHTIHQDSNPSTLSSDTININISRSSFIHLSENIIQTEIINYHYKLLSWDPAYPTVFFIDIRYSKIQTWTPFISDTTNNKHWMFLSHTE